MELPRAGSPLKSQKEQHLEAPPAPSYTYLAPPKGVVTFIIGSGKSGCGIPLHHLTQCERLDFKDQYNTPAAECSRSGSLPLPKTIISVFTVHIPTYPYPDPKFLKAIELQFKAASTFMMIARTTFINKTFDGHWAQCNLRY
jgi:hypothetical protein